MCVCVCVCGCVCGLEENLLSNDRGRRVKTEVSIVSSRVARFQRLTAGFAARSEVSYGQKEMPR